MLKVCGILYQCFMIGSRLTCRICSSHSWLWLKIPREMVHVYLLTKCNSLRSLDIDQKPVSP
jgi:hypothetical protein